MVLCLIFAWGPPLSCAARIFVQTHLGVLTDMPSGTDMYDNLPVPCLGNALVTSSNDPRAYLIPHLQQAPDSALGIDAIFCPQDVAHVLHVHKAGLEPIDHVIEGFRLAVSAASQKNTGQSMRQ